MIVKITYSVELEDVPMEVSKLIRELKEEFKLLSKDLQIASDELMENSKDIRTPVAKIDHSLEKIEKLKVKLKDCQAILGGYQGVLLKKNGDIPPPNPMGV